MRFFLISILLWVGATAASAAPACRNWDGVPTKAEGYIVSYVFEINPQDRVNSRGVALNDALALIQQDRANMHRFNAPGYLDEWDSFFTELDQRSMISNADLRTFCGANVPDLESMMIDARYNNAFIVDVFQESGRLVLFVSVMAG